VVTPSARPAATVDPADERLNVLYHKADKEYTNGQWQDAIRDFEEVLKKRPAHLPSLLKVALCYEQTNQLPRAEERLKKALSVSDHFTNGYVQLCDVYLKEKKFDEAKKQPQSILKYDPKNAQAYYLLGVVDYTQCHADQAAEDWERCIHLYEDYPAAQYNLGWARYECHNPQQAIQHILKATLLQTHYPKYEFALGYLDWANGDTVQGSRMLDSARQDGRLGPAFGAAAEAAMALHEKDYDKAMARAKAALEAEPDFAKAWVILAQAYQGKGDLVSARVAAERGVAADCNDFEAKALMDSLPPVPSPSPSAEPTTAPASGWSPGVMPSAPMVSPSASPLTPSAAPQ
jgi:superkiller protein 3